MTIIYKLLQNKYYSVVANENSPFFAIPCNLHLQMHSKYWKRKVRPNHRVIREDSASKAPLPLQWAIRGSPSLGRPYKLRLFKSVLRAGLFYLTHKGWICVLSFFSHTSWVKISLWHLHWSCQLLMSVRTLSPKITILLHYSCAISLASSSFSLSRVFWCWLHLSM